MVRDILASAGGVDEKLDVESVFSTYLYTGNSSNQTINNGIDLAGEGGMVWIKNRTVARNNTVLDTMRGTNKDLITNSSVAQITQTESVQLFNSNGFTLGTSTQVNAAGVPIVSWTFRKAPKFYTQALKVHTTGTPSTIDLSTLGVVGMVTVKSTVGISNWFAWHKDLTAGNNLKLNLTDAQSATNAYLSVSGTTLTISGSAPSDTYIVYAWAHDVGTDGIIQCGSFTTDGSGNATVNLGWEPQYLLTKSVGFSDNWCILDDKRGFPVASASTKILVPNSMSSESTSTGGFLKPTSTGFTVLPSAFGSTQTHIYLAIRRPNKVPTSGTEVYNAIARTGTGAVATVSGVGFAPDLLWCSTRSHNIGTGCIDRLRGGSQQVSTNTTSTEVSDTSLVTSFDMLGATLGIDNTGYLNQSERTYINHFFKRAPKFFDIVCYTGTGVARTVNHNLGVVPEMIWIKDRNDSSNWVVYHSNAGATKVMHLNTVGESYTYTSWNNTEPTLTNFTIGSTSSVNASAHSFISYLFASLQGISKVGSYAGNGTSQTIDCGFTTGSRFILVKRTDSAGGDWYFWDALRGIVAANDPHLSLNTTEAEVTTDDSVDPAVEGFIVNQNTATNINVNGGSYIFLAIA